MQHIILIITLLLFSRLAISAQFCVDNLTDLQNAFNISSSNGEDDVIKLKPGTFTAVNSTPITYNGTVNGENFALEISGGWSDIGLLDCVTQNRNSLATTLSGNKFQRVLQISANGSNSDITISNLSIVNGQIDNLVVLGALQMNLGGNYAGEVLIDRVYFANNFGFSGSAVHIFTSHNQAKFTVRNSVFESNTTTSGSGVFVLNNGGSAMNTEFYFINNTVMLNMSESVEPNAVSGLRLTLNTDPNSQVLLANNVFWLNDNSDFSVNAPQSAQTYVYNNNYQQGLGQFEDQANNFAGDPMLALDFTPLPGSPLIDQGASPGELPISTPFLQGWDFGASAFTGNPMFLFAAPRVVNRQVDIGAAEAPPEVPIFANGFE